jgi:hypothetical protein
VEGGWGVEKNDVPYLYRRHGASLTAGLSDRRLTTRTRFYDESIKDGAEKVTIFIPLSGRWHSVKQLLRFLDKQKYPKDDMSLIFLDSSGSKKFSSKIQKWLCKSGYEDYRYRKIDLNLIKGLADKDRRKPDISKMVQLAATRIYTQMKQMVQTEYVWIIEDDVIPPLDACERLLSHFNPSVSSVSGAYKSRYHRCYVAWTDDHRNLRSGHGVERIGGSGFGCLMLRKSILDQAVITHDAKYKDYDPNFFDWLNRYAGGKYQHLIDWDVECEHLETGDGNASSDIEPMQELFAYGMPLIGGGVVSAPAMESASEIA